MAINSTIESYPSSLVGTPPATMDGPPRGKSFYLCGFPIAQSTAPVFHNHLFKLWNNGTPNAYETWSTSRVTDDLVRTFLQDDFGGAT